MPLAFRLARSKVGSLFAALILSVSTLKAATVERAYYDALYRFCDALLTTQITAADAADRGALICPSVNPQPHPLHSRAGEAVYPLAVAFRETHDVKYRDAAIALGDWMITKQQASGAWGEDWPKYDGWAGTTSDQLISLAGAYEIMGDALSPTQRSQWQRAMTLSADYIQRTFPAGNVNYQPTGAVALCFATRVIEHPPESWRKKADQLIAITLAGINADGFITGEGNGVDLGYNIAQTIGYLALYGRLTGDADLRRRAAELLRVHAQFVYPNGSVDNSWGTRSFKWTYESGTKTAPGVYFTFALLQDQDPAFARTGRLCFNYLVQHDLTHDLVSYGPHAERHASTEVPCLYGTFARAQSIALAIAYAPRAAAGTQPVSMATSLKYFSTTKVALVRTETMTATVSGYGEIRRYGRGLVSRGGSLTNLWIQGFGENGFAETSSVTIYKREEAAHMPVENGLVPLTPRVETTIDGSYYTNLFEHNPEMSAAQKDGYIEVTATGKLLSATGADSGVLYEIRHKFYPRKLTKEYVIRAPKPTAVRIVEPIVKQPNLKISHVDTTHVELALDDQRSWRLAIVHSSEKVALEAGQDPEKYWCPFPAVECVPFVVNLTTNTAPAIVELELAPAP